MGKLPVPTREQIRAYFEGTTFMSETYVADLITMCHAILVELQEEQAHRAADPELQKLYDTYRTALTNKINSVDNNG
jgi:hypothetical protein